MASSSSSGAISGVRRRPARTRTRGLSALALVAALLVTAPPVVAQDTVTLSGADARDLATRAVLAGDPAVGREIARAMVAGDPADGQAWLILAAAELGLRNAPEALAAARRAHALLSGSPRHEAARLAARAEAAMGRFNLAQMWLRRALPDAPTEDAARATVAEAREASARALWRFSVSGGVTPSDNVNGGSRERALTIDGLDALLPLNNSADAMALSGWIGQLQVAAERRLSESAEQRTALNFRLGGRRVWLSDESVAAIDADVNIPDGTVTNADFSSAFAEIGLSHDRRAGDGLFGVDLALTRRVHWTDDDNDTRSGRLRLSFAQPVSDRASATVSGTVEQTFRDDGDPRLTYASIDTDLRLADVGPGDLSLGLSRASNRTDTDNRRYYASEISVRYDLARPVGPARLSFAMGVSQTEYPNYRILVPVPGGRVDDRVSLSMDAMFPDWSVMGFAPVVSITAEQTDSNVSRFDTENVGVGLNFRSTF